MYSLTSFHLDLKAVSFHSKTMDKMENKALDKVTLGVNQCIVKKTYCVHSKTKSFKRKTTEVIQKDGNRGDLVLLEYSFDGVPCPVIAVPHGNAKGSDAKPFVPTAPSTKDIIKSKASQSATGPSKIFDQAFEMQGGLQNMKAVSDLPRNRKQVKNARASFRDHKEKDELAELIEKSQSTDFLHSLQVAPSLRMVLSDKKQLRDLKEMCCDPFEYSVLGIDTTFNISRSSYLTPTVYNHLKLIDRESGKHPTMPGPAMIHNRLDAPAFQYFGNTLVELEPGLSDMMCIGSDRDLAIDKGFKQAFPIANLLACKKHVEDNIKKKLRDLGISGTARNEFLADVFGDDRKKEKGLVDCLSASEFDHKLLALRDIWDRRERSVRKTKVPNFFTYFKRNIAVDMKEKMLLDVRRMAGLGDNFYYNNASESMHDRIKKRIRQIKRDACPSGNTEKYCSLSEIVEIYKEITDETRRNIHRAIIDQGPYKLIDSLNNIKADPTEWRDMDNKEKEQRLKQIDPLYRNTESQQPTAVKCALGSFQDTGLPSIFKASWENANTIIERKGVSSAPGTKLVKVVLSLTNQRSPHFVTIIEKGRAIKCNCKGYEQRGLCAHVLAVAKLEGTLDIIISKWQPNLSNQVNAAAPSRVGQKPGPKRNRHPPVQRNVNSFGNRVTATTESSSEGKFVVVRVSTCKATTCYGCESKFRQRSTDPPPQPPWDILLRRKEFRVYNPQGCNGEKLKIAARKEFVYYHPRKRCILNKIDSIRPNDVQVPKGVSLGRLHKEQLRREFGLSLV